MTPFLLASQPYSEIQSKVTMAEQLNSSMGDFVARFIQRLSRDPAFAGRSDAEIAAEAIRRVKAELQTRDAAKNAEIARKRVDKTREWSEKAKSDDLHDQAEADKELIRDKYPDGLTLRNAKENLARVELVLETEAPDWLQSDVVQNSPEAAELVARITQLPPDLQDNPDVLLNELGKFYKSVKWSEMTDEVKRESRGLMDRVLHHIEEISGDKRDVLLGAVDHGVDVYHFETPKPGEPAGDPPTITDARGRTVVDQQSPEYAGWVESRIKEEQASRLQNTIETYQQILDLPQNRNPENQRKQLEKFIGDLRDGFNRGQKIKDIEGVLPPQFNREEAMKYVESAQTRLNKLNVEIQNTRAKLAEDRGIEAGRAIRWSAELQDLYKHKDHKLGEVLEIGYRLPKADIDDIVMGGVEGQRKWLARFRERWIGATGEPFKPGLEADMQFQEFMRIVTWLNGKEHTALTLQYKDLWSLYEDIDSIVKSTLYRPKGQKAEESFNILRYLTTTHHEMLRSYDLVDIAKPAVSESIEDTMRDEMFEYQTILNNLKEELRDAHDNVILRKDGQPKRKVDRLIELRKKYSGADEFDVFTELQEHRGRLTGEYRNKDGNLELDAHGRPLSKREKLEQLERKYANIQKLYGELTKPEYDEMLQLDVQLDRIGRGVLLRDYHMIAQIEPYNKLTDLYKKYTDFKYDHPDLNTLTDAQRTERQEIVDGMRSRWKEFTRNNNATFDPDTDGELLMELRNFSPVEIRARERVVQALRNEWLKTHPSLETEDRSMVRDEKVPANFNNYLKQESYKIRDAIWAARTIVVGTGEAMEKGAKLGRAAMFDIQFTLGLPKEIQTKHFMDRGFAEAYQRVLNPYIFEDDFHMGSLMGEVARELNYESAFNLVGYDYKKDKSMPQEWKDMIRKAENGQLFADGNYEAHIPVWVVYTQYAQEVMGMSFTEAIRPDLLATGLQQLSTYWRMQRVALEPIIEAYLKTRTEGESAEFQAMGLQLASLKEDNLAGRRQVLERMLQRKPSIFFKLVGEDLGKVLNEPDMVRLHPGTLEWQQFQDTLALIEVELWRNTEFANKPYNLTEVGQFTSIAQRAVRATHQNINPRDIDSRVRLYFRAVNHMQEYMHADGANGKMRMDNWAAHKFTNLLLLTSSDFNWQKTNFTQLDMYGIERRVGDFQNQNNAETIRRDVLTKSEFLSPISGKEVETLTKIKEFRDAVIMYAGDDTGEIAQTSLMETVINFNRNRAIRSLAGWVPGAVSVMRRMGVVGEDMMVNVENLPFGWDKPVKKFLEDKKLRGKPLNKWPRSVANSVSLAVGFGGPEANAWDEFKIAGFLAGAETSMMYIKKPDLLAKMRNKFKSTLLSRLAAVPRKYWWVIPIATIAVAAMASIEEEKKKSG